MNSKRIGSIVGALVALGIAASFTLFGGKVLELTHSKQVIRDLLTNKAGLSVSSVTCPSDVKVGKGIVSYCTATLANGHTVRFSVTQTNGDGHVFVKPAEMISDQIQLYVDKQLAAQGVTATTVCPQHEPVVIGRTFDCVASDKAGHSVKLAVTVRSSDAGFAVRVAS